VNDTALIVADLVAVLFLAFALYFPRYHRRDMVLAIVSINVGVLAVALVLSRADVTAGLGFGLFGVLSIIRLRSQELDQEEVAYYFSAIALGLLGGVRISPDWIAVTLMAAIVVALFIVDHPRLFQAYRNQMVTLDCAVTDEAELTTRLETLLGGDVVKMKVKRVDLVDDTTVVDVRYKLRAVAPAGP
jgi:Domain of unknown function (DUF4956)